MADSSAIRHARFFSKSNLLPVSDNIARIQFNQCLGEIGDPYPAGSA
jgi:hypothetical protein